MTDSGVKDTQGPGSRQRSGGLDNLPGNKIGNNWGRVGDAASLFLADGIITLRQAWLVECCHDRFSLVPADPAVTTACSYFLAHRSA